MDQNIAVWMIVGGRRMDPVSVERDRANLRALRDGPRRERIGLIDRLRPVVRPATPHVDLVGCAA